MQPIKIDLATHSLRTIGLDHRLSDWKNLTEHGINTVRGLESEYLIMNDYASTYTPFLPVSRNFLAYLNVQ